MTGFRLSEGGRVDRAKTLRIRFDRRTLHACPGDTLASAMLANGETIVGRGFKYHRPRGVTSAGVEESGAIVTVGCGARRVANQKATMVELHEGLEAFGQNAFPSVRFDLGRINDALSRFFAAGFYYKTFIGPFRGTRWWMTVEPIIRHAAGMGRASREPDPDRYEIVHDHCDLLVVGAGPAGLAAAEAGAEAGLDVILAEQDFELGGDLLGASGNMGRQKAEIWRAARLSALAASTTTRIWPRATVFGLYDGMVAGVLERVTDHLAAPDAALPRERVRIIRARRIVLATGALERGLAFGDNDRPGVMNASAARIYARRFGVGVGRRVVMTTTHDGAYADAIALAEAGIETVLADSRVEGPIALRAKAESAGVSVRVGMVPVKIEGRHAVRGVWLGAHEGGGKARPRDLLRAECVAVSGGWSPVIHLLSHRKAKPVWSDAHVAFLPGETREPIAVCGAASGLTEAADCARAGRAAGLAAAQALGRWGKTVPSAPAASKVETAPDAVFEVTAMGRKLKSFVDLQHDVSADDIRLAAREGFVSVEHMKRYTTLGMATDQGKVGNILGLAIMADATDRTIPDTGTTTFRPPYTPVSIGAFAGSERGALWRPTRRTPMHDAAERAGAVCTDAGLWRRSWYFPEAGETLATASMREAATVRDRVGLVDVSTLGKIAVQGPDAAEFLNRVYMNGFAKLPVGKARYGAMLRDDGIVLDDGTTWRISETDFFMTTTTAEAAEVMKVLERLLQTRWTDLRVHVSSVSDGWAGVAVAGPLAREVLSPLIPDIDFSPDAYPFMAVREGALQGGAPVRTARLSFSGELAWEAFVPADYGPALWEAASDAVLKAGGVLYGLEALDILRVEKGHVTAREIDGRLTLDDVGLGRMASKTKDHVGKALAARPELTRRDRPSLVGLRPVQPGARYGAGAVLCKPGHVHGHGVGWISSIADSPALGARIALGFAEGGLAAWEGERLIAADPVRGEETELEVVSPHFFDPEGKRLHV